MPTRRRSAAARVDRTHSAAHHRHSDAAARGVLRLHGRPGHTGDAALRAQPLQFVRRAARGVAREEVLAG
eukprot:1498455-Prymnesium_polylepis.1